MKELFSTFSITDFLAYFFPGLVLTIGMYILALLIPPLNKQIMELEITWVTWFLVIPIGYFLGIISSSLCRLVELDKQIRKKRPDIENPLKNEYLKDYKEDIEKAYNTIYKGCKSWSFKQFYAIRSVVRIISPSLANFADRQNSLRQMRRNSILPVIVWVLIGIVFSLKSICFLDNSCYLFPCYIFWFRFCIIFPIVIGSLIIYSLLRGMNRNREFEVRDFCLAFILLDKQGKLSSKNNENKQKDKISNDKKKIKNQNKNI